MRKGIIYVYFNRAKYEKEGIEKYYIGQTVGTMEQRAGKDGKYYGWDNPNCNSKFARSIRKWGWDAFEGRVLEEVYEEDLNELEKFYIERFDSYKNGYNSTIGGEGIRGYNPYANKTEEEMKEIKEKLSKVQIKRFENEEERKKQSEISKNIWEDKERKEKIIKAIKKSWEDPEKRKKQSKSIKKRFEDKNEIEKISKAQKKRFENEEERKKISEAIKKYYEKQESREKQSEASIKSWEDPERIKKQSIAIKKYYEKPESREKRSKISKKLWEDPERRKRRNEKLSGEKNYGAKKVYCRELNIVFSYIKIAEKYCINVLNIKIGPISGVCNCKRNFTGKLTDGTKLTWKWLEDVDQETLDNAEYIDSEKYEEIIKAKLNENK